MGKALIVAGPRQLAYQDYEDVALKPDEVRIQTLYSGISAGTEMTQYRGANPYMNKRWDEATRLYIESDAPSWTYPVSNIGYEKVGKIVQVGAGVNDIPLGTVVFGPWWHRTHYVTNAEWVRQRLTPIFIFNPSDAPVQRMCPLDALGIADVRYVYDWTKQTFEVLETHKISVTLAPHDSALLLVGPAPFDRAPERLP